VCVCVLGAVAYLQVSPLGRSRDETWRGQGIRERSVLEFAKTESIVTVQRRFRSTYHTEPRTDKTIREWLPVRCETNRPAGVIGRDCRACARNVCQEPSEVNTSREPGIADASVKCLAHSAQTSSREKIPAAASAGAESPGSQSSFSHLRGFPPAARGRWFAEKLVFSDKATFHVCVVRSQLTQFWQIPRHRTLSYSLSTPCFVTTAPWR
jgi:hypothetical protein